MQSNTQKTKSNKSLIVEIVALILLLTLTVLQTSYSWISRKWEATVSRQQIRIEAYNSIAFKLEDGSSATMKEADLLELIQGTTNFVLRPVSNCTGGSEDFFKLERKDLTKSGWQFVHITDPQKNWQATGSQNGYIETKIFIVGSDTVGSGSTQVDTSNRQRYVFLNPISHIEDYDDEKEYPNSAADAIRVSLSYTDEYGQHTVILSKQGEERGNSYKAISNVHLNPNDSDSAYLFDGCPYFTDNEMDRVNAKEDANGTLQTLTTDVDVQKITDYTGFVYDESGEKYIEDGYSYVDVDRCLFALPLTENGQVALTIRVWLEGEDENCTDGENGIAGRMIDLLLSFNAVTCFGEQRTVNGHTNCYRVVDTDIVVE